MTREDTEQRWVDTSHEDRKGEILINVILHSTTCYLVRPETRHKQCILRISGRDILLWWRYRKQRGEGHQLFSQIMQI